MKRKNPDQLWTAVFDGHADRSLSDLSAEERREVQLAEAVREGLRGLRDVPECQLSTERVRDAILSRSVRPARRTGAFTWLATAAAAVVAVMAWQNLGRTEPTTVAIETSVPTSVPEEALRPTVEDVLPPIETMVPKGDVVVDDAQTAEPPEVLMAEPAATRLSEVRSTARGGERLADYALAELPTAFSSSFQEEPTLTIVSFTPEREDAAPSGVVVVEHRQNPDTGAYVATEVETFGDVVFGG